MVVVGVLPDGLILAASSSPEWVIFLQISPKER